MMKKTIYLLLTTILLTTGCSEKTNFTLKGEFSDLTSDTLLAYYLAPKYKIDTIICQKGKFEYSFTPDTLNVFSLIFNTEESLPIFADKGQTVEVKGTTTDFEIKGEGENKLMNDIFNLLRSTSEEKTMDIVDSLIRTNKYSFTNLYLLDKYYTNDKQTDSEHINKLIESQSGIIKDSPYIMELQGRISHLSAKQKNLSIQNLNGQDRKGEKIKWPSNRENYILIDFWASWHPESVAAQDSLVSVLKELKKEKFLVFSVSLDMDREAWLKASERDTTQWYQVCDFKGWNNNILKNQGVRELPFNILLDKNKRIIAKNIRGKELINKVKEFIKEDKEREKAAKKRKRK